MKTKKFLEQENEWLWFHHFELEPNTAGYEFKQYNRNGKLISFVSGYIPKGCKRPEYPKVKK